MSTMKTRIMYVETKSDNVAGIGRVAFSKSLKTIYYGDLVLERCNGIQGNHIHLESRTEYWVSGPKRDGSDRLFHQRLPIDIDEDVRVEYWTQIRKEPARVNEKATSL